MSLAYPENVIQQLKSGDEGLVKLKLVYVPPSSNHLQELIKLLPQNETVEYVLLERRFVNSLSEDEYPQVLFAIGKMKALKEMEIWSVAVPLSTLCQALRPTQTLTKLGLGFVGIYDFASCEFLERHPSLTRVYLSEFRLSNQEIGYDANDPEEVSPNFDSFLRALSTCPALETIELFSSRADGDPWSPEALAGLIESESLRCLTLRRLHLGTPHVLALAQALQTHHQNPLRVLDLSENYIGDHASARIAQAVATHPHLRSLSLRDSSITAVGCRQLATALLHNFDSNEHHGVMDKLNLAGNTVSDAGAAALADLLVHQDYPTLKYLEVTRAGMTDKGCVVLAAAIRENTTLENLGLAYNKMTTPSYIAFAEALRINRTLKSIQIQASRIGIGLEGSQALADMLRDNMVLENVSTLLADTLDVERNQHKKQIASYLLLNTAGRRRELLQGHPSKRDWVEAIARVQSDFNAIHYLVVAQPSICGR